MRQFIHDDFLLTTPGALELYHNYAATVPILDFHCHLPPQEVAQDKRWANLTEVWLGGDHYKWRAMRSNGVEERFITGDATAREKFDKFAETMPYLLRNPMYDWSHLELARYFGMTDLLSPKSADRVWERTQEAMAQPEFSARGLMVRSGVKLVCTTDDPVDDLAHHLAVRAEGFEVKMLPTWRPDKALAVERTEFWNAWVDKLEAATGMNITTYDDFLSALQMRHDFFAAAGCVMSDYGLTQVEAEDYTESEVRAIFLRARGERVAPATCDAAKFRSAMLYVFGRMDAASGWAWQIHYGVLRNNNSRLFAQLGPDVGCDSVGDFRSAAAMAKLFDRLDAEDALPKTVIYPINPCDNEVVATMLGNFQRGPTVAKMQFGSGWWFNDQRDGMLRQMEALSQLGLLSRFVGMLTDSRSFLSYTRHEYFRRILCARLGQDMADGIIPNDIDWTGQVVRDICFNNANRYFGFGF